MIPRYDHPEISTIWTDDHKFQTFLKVEIALLGALEKAERIPQGVTQNVQNRSTINLERISELEAKVHHDVVAFCSSISEQLPRSESKYFHFGVTSSDIIDTALNLQIKESIEHIEKALHTALESLKVAIQKTEDTLSLGRSHGMYAEPIIFAQKWISSYAELARRLEDLQEFKTNNLKAQFSGAVGNYTVLTPEIESNAAKNLGLQVENVSTQVIPRDHLAKLTGIISLIGAAIERVSGEIRHLQHSDVGELAEGFSKGQKGSSTMPHKKNPISTENLSGIARVLKSHHQIALENCNLWHERDISHSSAERIYLPDSLGLCFYGLKRLASTIDNLVYHKDVIEEKVKNNDHYLSSYYLHHLIENSDQTREALYEIVQSASFHSIRMSESFFFSLQNELRTNKIDIELPKVNFSFLKDLYMDRFRSVKKRVNESYSHLKLSPL